MKFLLFSVFHGQREAGKRRPYRFVRSLSILLMLCMLSGCGESSRVVFTTGLGKEDVFRIDDIRCTRAELMIYLITAQNQYENVYGPEVWKVSKGNVTLEENVKDTVLEKTARIKTMCLLAKSRNLELEDREKELVEKAAEDFFSALSEEDCDFLGISRESIVKMYSEYALASKVYREIIGDVNPEVSDDEARTITIQHILLRTWTTNGSGTRIEYGDDVKRSVYRKACEIRDMAVDGEQDFLELASKYSDDANITYSFGKGEAETGIETVAFLLETNEISDIIETEDGYHIIKCISTFDREQTDISKLKIAEERRREKFGEEYDAFAGQLTHQLNTKLWDEIAIVHDKKIDMKDFFEVYEKYFSESLNAS
ncbi:MAG: peptidylprolyl isomerase [Acetatifactor sp.]